MSTAKKTTAKRINGHHRNGVVPPEQLALLEKEYRKLKTDKAREQFWDRLTEDERYYLWLAIWDAEGAKERLEMLGVL